MANEPTTPGRWNVEPPPSPAKIKVVSEGGYVQHVDDLNALGVPQHPPPTVVAGPTDDEKEKCRRSASPALALADWEKEKK